MRFNFRSLALIIFAALAGLVQPALARQITFVPVQQNRDQAEPQQGLPPDKKRSLSRIGPEDVFSDQEMNDARKSQSRRKPQPSAVSTPTPAPRQSATPRVTPYVTPSVAPAMTPSMTPSIQTVSPTPSPAVNIAALDDKERQPPLNPLAAPVKFVSKWTVPVLSALALLVFAALIHVLNKLRGFLKVSG